MADGKARRAPRLNGQFAAKPRQSYAIKSESGWYLIIFFYFFSGKRADNMSNAAFFLAPPFPDTVSGCRVESVSRPYMPARWPPSRDSAFRRNPTDCSFDGCGKAKAPAFSPAVPTWVMSGGRLLPAFPTWAMSGPCLLPAFPTWIMSGGRLLPASPTWVMSGPCPLPATAARSLSGRRCHYAGMMYEAGDSLQ